MQLGEDEVSEGGSGMGYAKAFAQVSYLKTEAGFNGELNHSAI